MQAKQVGLDGVAFCETRSSSLCIDAIELGRTHDIEVFIGVEIPTDHGIKLGFVPEVDDFYLGEEWRSVADVKAPPAEAVLELFEGRGGAIIASRPYDLSIPFNMGDRIFTFDKLSAVEAFSSRVDRAQQNFAMEAAKFMDVPSVGGSDPTASLDAVGRYATYFDGDLNSQSDFVEALLEAEYWAVEIGESSRKNTRRSSNRSSRSSKAGASRR
ncbi:MAG: PHP domain-containing protein [Persicimonas sp.]